MISATGLGNQVDGSQGQNLNPKHEGTNAILVLILLVVLHAILPNFISLIQEGRPPPEIPIALPELAANASVVLGLLAALDALWLILTAPSPKRVGSVGVAWLIYLSASALASFVNGSLPFTSTALSGLVILAVSLRPDSPSYIARTCLLPLSLTCVASLLLEILMPQIAQFGSNDPATLGRGARLAGIFEHPNQLGLISGLAIVLGMLSFISEKKYLTLLAITPAFLTIVLSQSYTAWLATICAIVIPTIFSRRERFENGRALHKFVKVLWIVLIVAAAYGVTVTLSSDGNISSISQRQIVWATVLTHWADTPVLGHGVGIWQNLISSGSVPLWAVHAHNQYLNALFVGGLVGLITLMYALLRTAIASWIQLKLGFLTVAGVLTFQIVRSLTEVPFDLSYASISLLTIIIFVASKVRQISP